MLKLANLSLPVGHGPEALRRKAAAVLGVNAGAVEELTILRQSIDARKKSDVRWVYTVALSLPGEAALAGRGGAVLYAPEPYRQPTAKSRPKHPPVVVGMGPAGLFAALTLARAGLAPIVLERGRRVEERTADVERFWQSG